LINSWHTGKMPVPRRLQRLLPLKAPRHMIGFFRLKRTLRLGLRSLWAHKLRSSLTVLGIVFGVCSVIAMLAIGEGASKEAQEQIKELGSQNIILRSAKPPEDQSATAQRSFVLTYGLTYADAERIVGTIPSVEVVVAARDIRRGVRRRTRRRDGRIVGTVPWHPEVANLAVARGRFVSTVDMHAKANVCVLGAAMAEALFPFDDPIGDVVKVGTDYYCVIGVMARVAKGTAAKAGSEARSTDLDVYIPLTTARDRFGEIVVKISSGSREMERVELHQIIVKVAHLEQVLPTGDAIRTLLKRFHSKKDYDVLIPLELLQQAELTKRIFNIVLGSIAAISLVVGGIGIMNIMLATVTERTREIGIRRAMGAKKHDIIVQFLTETVLLSGCGGLLGVAFGVIIPLLVTHFAKMATVVTWWSLALAFFISAGVGIVFGLYPAYRAAQMDPIEALRHE